MMRHRYLRRRLTRNQVFIGSAVAVGLLAAGTHGHTFSPQTAATATAAAYCATGAPQMSTSSPNVATGRDLAAAYGWASCPQWGCLDALWTRESGWQMVWNAAGSGAYGIPQSLPASKMAAAGGDYMTNPATEIKWGLGYVQVTYGTPCGAWSHEQSAGWY